MQRTGDVKHLPRRDDFGEGDHQEYVEPGFKEAVLVGGLALVLVGAFVISLFG